MTRYWWSALTLFLVVACVGANDQHPLGEVLGRENRWEQVKGLRDWHAPLSAGEAEALREFVTHQDGKDWVLYRLGQRLLRANTPGASQPSAEVLQAEEILLSPQEKETGDQAAARVEALVEQGPDTIPLLQEVLAFDTLTNWEQKKCAIQALRRLGSAQLAPFVREQARKEPHRNVREELLLTLLSWDPSDENIGFAAEVLSSREKDSEPRWTVQFFEQSALSQRTKFDLFLALHDALRPERQYATVEAFGRMDTPEALKVLSDIARKQEYRTFSSAVRALAQLRNTDPTPVLLELAGTPQLEAFAPGVLCLARNGRKEAIPVFLATRRELAEQRAELEARLASLARELGLLALHGYAGGDLQSKQRSCIHQMESVVQQDIDLQQKDMILAGGLAGLGEDYDTNARQIRDALTDWHLWHSAFQVVGVLTDDATVDRVCAIVLGEDVWKAEGDTGQTRVDRMRRERLEMDNANIKRRAIRALGEIGSPRAHQPLVKALHKLGEDSLREIAQALIAIGTKSSLPDVVLEGEDVLAVDRALRQLRYGHAQMRFAGSAEAEHDRRLLERAKQAVQRRPYLRRFLLPGVLPASPAQ